MYEDAEEIRVARVLHTDSSGQRVRSGETDRGVIKRRDADSKAVKLRIDTKTCAFHSRSSARSSNNNDVGIDYYYN